MDRQVRRLLKFLHTLGGVGLMGAMACLLVLLALPAPTAPEGYAALTRGMAAVMTWVFLPSMVMNLIAGLLAIAVNPALHEAGWAWLKAGSGILVFEGALHVLGPVQDEAKRSAAALSRPVTTAMTGWFSGERNTLWVLLAVAAANIALGVWRPRLPRIPV